MPNMFASRRTSITCEEEERRILGYEITLHYSPRLKAQRIWKLALPNGEEAALTYEHNGTIFTLNHGSRSRAAAEPEVSVKPFQYCSACRKWLTEGTIEEHLSVDSKSKCSRNAGAEDIIRDAWLFFEGHHDVFSVLIPKNDSDLPEGMDRDSFYITLKEAFLRAVLLTFSLDENEVGAFAAPAKNGPYQRIILYETEEGGIGILSALQDLAIFRSICQKALEIVHIENSKTLAETEDACEKSCYDCLLGYWNQREHQVIDRSLILNDLQALVNVQPAGREPEPPSDDRFQLLLNLCESNLEKKVLTAIRDQELPLPDSSQRLIFDRDEPIAKADFFYEKNLCVFVDGPPHEKKHVQIADQKKRRKLKALGYRVIVLHGVEDLDKLNKFLSTLTASAKEPQAKAPPETLPATPYSILQNLEQFLRDSIVFLLKEHYGSQWWKAGIPQDVRQNCEHRKEKGEAAYPWLGDADYSLIAYADFSDYGKIIERKDNWNQVFKPIIRKKEAFIVKLRELEPIRNAIAHSRPLNDTQLSTLILYAQHIKKTLQNQDLTNDS